MNILLKGVRIVAPSSPFHQQEVSIQIVDGRIQTIGSENADGAHIIEAAGLCASPGWFDSFAHFNDPGFEYKETIETGAAAAAAGGFTDVMIIPNTSPVLHNKASIEYVIRRGREAGINIHPIGAVTRNTEGKELAEMYDMHSSGALAFSDGTTTIQSAGLFLKALQYVKPIDAPLIQVPDDRSLSAHGLMHEGIISTRLGLPGMPPIAEELMIQRDIELLRYTGSKLHLTGVSTAKGIAAIKTAKEEGLQLTCSITPFHLAFCDEDLSGYDTNLKLRPALRSRDDREALRRAVSEGVVDAIASHHFPQDPDHKIVEFEYAHFGMTSLETSFALVRTALPELPIEALVHLFCGGPRAAFGVQQPAIETGAKACLTLFQPEAEWQVEGLRSKSKNSALMGKTLTGRPYGIINGDRLFLNQ